MTKTQRSGVALVVIGLATGLIMLGAELTHEPPASAPLNPYAADAASADGSTSADAAGSKIRSPDTNLAERTLSDRVRVVAPPAQASADAGAVPAERPDQAPDDSPEREAEQSPAAKALRNQFTQTAMGQVLECMAQMVAAGHSFRGELAFDVTGESIDEGMVDFRVDSLEVRPREASTARDMPPGVIECLDQSINSLVAELPSEAQPLFADTDSAQFETELALDLKGAEVAQ